VSGNQNTTQNKQGTKMKQNPITRRAFALSFIAITALVLSSFATVSAAEPSTPKTADLKKPVKVFILAGQSNMQGPASVKTFDSLASDPKTAPLLKEMRNADGTPRVCDKVWISSLQSRDPAQTKSGKLSVGYGMTQEKFGPEFTFGITMEKHRGEPILIIKPAWGGKSLNTDFRPPSAGPYVFTEQQIAALKKAGRNIEEAKAQKAEATGVFYRLMMQHIKNVLSDVSKVYPDYDPKQGYELAGFVWFQGWNDMVDDKTYPGRDKPGGYDPYSKLMADFIRDVRKDLNAPKMPFVIGVMGVGGDEAGPTIEEFRKAQAAPASLAEFKGNVVAVETAPFWDAKLAELSGRWGRVKAKSKELGKDKSLTPEQRRAAQDAYMKEVYPGKDLETFQAGVSNAAYHYLGSAKIFAQIGQAFAEAMIKMEKQN
jgi:alpha-galactosidase